MTLVALTGYGQDTDKQRALSAGFDEHLTKPVKIERLQALLNRPR
jgi:CheY-like chemotaxis protein